jgi:cell division protein FtsL
VKNKMMMVMSLSLLLATGAVSVQTNSGNEIKQDNKIIKADISKVKEDRKELRADQKQVNLDKKELRIDKLAKHKDLKKKRKHHVKA